ncbi:hypothetical protein JCM10908_001295 [Rhodotorula pacifica]|uniref:uncharacterized protein n=1 Tax=Rhodotorula pacifica TaxID=1495444 RepID=UPI00317D3CC5
MASLLALLLVAKSSAGAQLVYAYPPHPRAVPRTHKPVYFGRRKTVLHSVYNSSSSSSDADSDSEDDDDDGEYRGPDSKTFLGFPDPVLAALLSPSRELCDQPFELVVDHLAFVGHPVWLGDEDGGRDAPGGGGGGGNGGAVNRNEVDNEDEDGDDDTETRGRSRRPRSSLDRTANAESETDTAGEGDDSSPGARDATVGPPTSRTASAPPRPMLIPDRTGDSPRRPDLVSRSHSSTTTTLHPGSSIVSSQHSQSSLASLGRLTSFNLLCVVDTPPDSHLSSHLEGYYKDLVLPVTANMKALEKRDHWLGKEAAKLRRAREAALEKDTPWDDFLATLPAKSSLAGAISQLYTSLKRNELAEVHFGPLPVQILLRGELPVEDDFDPDEREKFLVAGPDHPDLASPDRQDRSLSPGGHAYAKHHQAAPLFSRMRRRPPVKFEPWESLLLLEDARILQRDVLEDSLLWRFLDICRPTLTFAEYETLLDMEAEEHLLNDLVDHLVHWNKARVIDLVSLKGTYITSPSFEPKKLAKLSATFREEFPTLPSLPRLLSHLIPNEPFSAIIPSSQRPPYLNALIWLLRNEVVAKQRTYVRIVAGESLKRATTARWDRVALQSGISLASSSKADDASQLSTSAGATSDHSFGAASRRSDGKFPKQSVTSSRLDVEDTKGMVIVSSAVSGGSPRETPAISMSQKSASMFAARMAGRKRPGARSHQGGSGYRSGKGFSTATMSSHSERPDEGSSLPSVIVEPGRPSMLESRLLSEMCRDKDSTAVAKFDRIVRLLNGRHHLDEIRYRSQLSRKQLQTTLAAFEEHLVFFHHA